MADSKGVQDNKCFKEIDLQPIYDRIAELEKKALTLDMIINADGLVTQAHSPIPDEYEIYNQTKDTLLSRTATKAGYFPIGALITPS